MRYFITGASGWIGSAVTAELIENGHEVVGLARSDASAAKLEAMGATVQRGDLEDLDSLRAGAEGTDGIVHCGFIHDFSAFEKSVAVNHAAVELFGELLEGTGKPLVIASGILGFFTDETQRVDPADAVSRMATEALLLGLADRGVRSVSVRLAPTVHGQGDHGFIASMVAADKNQGAAGYIAGTHWPAVHRFDAAHLFCIALDRAPAGTVMHAIAESGVSIQAVAEAVGEGLGIPVREVPEAEASEFFGWLGRFLALDTIATSEITQREFDWKPTHPTLLEDLEAGYYFA